MSKILLVILTYFFCTPQIIAQKKSLNSLIKSAELAVGTSDLRRELTIYAGNEPIIRTCVNCDTTLSREIFYKNIGVGITDSDYPYVYERAIVLYPKIIKEAIPWMFATPGITIGQFTKNVKKVPDFAPESVNSWYNITRKLLWIYINGMTLKVQNVPFYLKSNSNPKKHRNSDDYFYDFDAKETFQLVKKFSNLKIDSVHGLSPPPIMEELR